MERIKQFLKLALEIFISLIITGVILRFLQATPDIILTQELFYHLLNHIYPVMETITYGDSINYEVINFNYTVLIYNSILNTPIAYVAYLIIDYPYNKLVKTIKTPSRIGYLSFIIYLSIFSLLIKPVLENLTPLLMVIAITKLLTLLSSIRPSLIGILKCVVNLFLAALYIIILVTM